MEQNFCKVRSMGDMIIVLLLILVGFGFIILPGFSTINIIGIVITLLGIVLAFTLKSAYQDKDTGEIYSKKERFFSQTKHEHLKHALACPSKFCSKGEDEGTTLRLDVYYNDTRVIIQLLEYVPFTYEPCTQFYEHDVDTAAAFIRK